MSVSLKTIYPCDHIVTDHEKVYGDVLMVRSLNTEVPDKVPANTEVLRVDVVVDSTKKKSFSPTINYNQSVSKNIIEWTNDKENPLPGESYYIRCSHIKTSINKFTADNCNRCNGNGWYSDLIASGKANLVSGAEKLSQDFIKILFTEKDENGNGSDIKNVLGRNVYNEVELGLNISMAVEDVVTQLKNSQIELVNNGATLPDDEAIEDVEIKDVIFIREEAACYVTINIRNKSGGNINFSFMI